MTPQDIDAYLASWEMPDPIAERVKSVMSTFKFLCPNPAIERVFISNTISESGERVLEDIWAFAGPFWLCAQNFQRKYDIDVSPYSGSLFYLSVQYEDIDFPNGVNDKSKMSVEVGSEKVSYNKFSATGRNCENLIEIVNDILAPALVEHAGNADV